MSKTEQQPPADAVYRGCLGCLTDDCEHWDDGSCKQWVPCIIGRNLTEIRKAIEIANAKEAAIPRDPEQKSGIELIAEERARQIEVEGFDAAHDDQHSDSEMAYAAVCYILAATAGLRSSMRSILWPWSAEWWKPSPDEIRNLVKAGALIAAEIDRLQRERVRVREVPQ